MTKTEQSEIREYFKKNSRRLVNIYKKDTPETKDLFGVERLILALLLITRYFSIVHWFRCLFCSTYIGFKRFVDFWSLFKPMTLLLLLFFIDGNADLESGLAMFFLFDLYSALLSSVFLSLFNSKPISTNRNLILLILNFIESTLAYSLIYLNGEYLTSSCKLILDELDAIYFSLATATTVGYGDLVSINRVVPISQMMMSFIFIGVVISVFVSRSIESKIKT
jgi:hypothetical protein